MHDASERRRMYAAQSNVAFQTPAMHMTNDNIYSITSSARYLQFSDFGSIKCGFVDVLNGIVV